MVPEHHESRHKNGRLEEGRQAQPDDLPRPAGKAVPRGYLDGFTGWTRQVVGLCLTAFLQSTILVAGLMVFKDHALMGVGLMLSAGEVPRIAGSFGVDTTTKANFSSAVYTARSAVSAARTLAAVVR